MVIPRIVKIIHIYYAYKMIMTAVKRIPVTEPIRKELFEMRSAGLTNTELLEELIKRPEKRIGLHLI
jgi:hypothetical protein